MLFDSITCIFLLPLLPLSLCELYVLLLYTATYRSESRNHGNVLSLISLLTKVALYHDLSDGELEKPSQRLTPPHYFGGALMLVRI